ncbi:FAD-dependent oxidoreductase [Streptomyces sp. NPDC005805]|uniref:FAD-dependent oxidoreductase n=1 Tax=Streptomyces sp. NPDC005805 TaxID=3157068 RepID=UPI0033C44E6F
MKDEVLVLGGGVIGLATAVELAERGHRVRVWAREPAVETVSAVAGALWWPYRIDPEELVGEWALASLRVYERMAAAGVDEGVRMVPGVHAEVSLAGLGPWAARVAELREATPQELPAGVPSGLRARLPLVDMPVHLRALERRLAAAGGTVERRAADSLSGAAADTGAAVVVNCTGLGARELVPDPGMLPVRGVLVLVENPGVTEWFTAADAARDETTYLFPQPGRLILGGTAQAGAESLVADPAEAAAIVARCARVHPAVAGARVLGYRVGLRPYRAGGVRLAAERLPGGGVPVVHNYGHGGAGVTVAWGCAKAAADLVDALG